ncbi:hypothetical protein GCM10010353_29650 [Streptomyces chryseus]|nr:hypothetical protein GCM10010353_29650 [Streptomyces chryseus]
MRELRFHLDTAAFRITYWLAPNRRIVLLTVCRKTRMREDAQVERAVRAQKECEAAHCPAEAEYHRHIRGARMSGGYHTEWKIPDEHRVDPAYIEAGASIALGQAVYDFRVALGLSETELARRAGLTEAEVEQIEGGGTVPTLPLLRQLASALDAQLDVSIGSDAMSLAFVPHAA